MARRDLPGDVPTPRDALNELKWSKDALGEVVVWYRHRGAPNDRRAVAGERILDLGRSFMRVDGPRGGTSIPYHRVLVIEQRGHVVWRRIDVADDENAQAGRRRADRDGDPADAPTEP